MMGTAAGDLRSHGRALGLRRSVRTDRRTPLGSAPCLLSRLSARLTGWLRSSKSSTSARKIKISRLNNCSQQGCSFAAWEKGAVWGCSCQGLFGPLSRGVLCEVFLKTCDDQEWDGPFPSPVDPRISPSASSGGCLTWGLTSSFARGFVSCPPAPAAASPPQAAEALALEVVCLVAGHPQPTLPVSTEKILAKTKSDLVGDAGCSNYARLHKCR